ncbi:arrestin domain-containing protein 3-like [Ruditapes philippinarum]|uniref:arrestin domain-containing protein 3-like n=1 Tax=Ruditapes philippinarum TaxID=129788 RepID=UPI00295C2D3F|nr:arrestin domain-containing protein 3-like [Ruditapes philippinarum]
MALQDLSQIVLDNPTGVFYPGQLITGKFELVLTEKKTITAINFISKGQAKCQWTEGAGENAQFYDGHEKYFHFKECLFGKQQSGKSSVKFKPGKYEYPFKVQLPSNIPASFEAFVGQVRYSLKAHIDIRWAKDKYCKKLITIVVPLDLNTIPNVTEGATNTGEKRLCCLCCESDPISGMIAIDRKGYVPGEMIIVRGEINNQSNRKMTCTKVCLQMVVTYHATTKSMAFKQTIGELKHGKLKGGETEIFNNERLHIPPVSNSYLHGCKIIDINYFVEIIADPSGPGFDLEVPVEIIIGSIPLTSVAEQHGLSLSTQEPMSVSLPQPGNSLRGLYTDLSMPTNIPTATMTESATGRVKIKVGKGSKDTVEYAPVYTYYNWNTHDTDTLFSVQKEK